MVSSAVVAVGQVMVKLNPQLRHRKMTVTTVSPEVPDQHYTFA